jgi:2-polyprenyl-3-methyl-5-hydroxy-6-metoxy-1,4-benzoquinol methylase
MTSAMQSVAPNDERRKREATFHDQWAESIDVAETLVDETFTSATAVENQHILQEFGDLRGLTVLDYGCGAAEGGIFLAKRGARVVAVDVSAHSLEVANKLAKEHGVEIETRLVTSDKIPAADGEFDRIYGNGVLHHVPLDTAIPELARVLKQSGKACFIEPLPYNPLINVYRKIAKEVRTPDEHPISFRQVESFKSSFGEVTHREFWLTSLLIFVKFYAWDRVNPNRERYWKKIYTDARQIAPLFLKLSRIDNELLTRLPGLGRMCWNTVISVSKPIK